MSETTLPRTLASEAQEPKTLVEGAYKRLRRDIIEGTHAPGDKLRVEHLKERYDVGAGTLREALLMLVTDALVVAQGQRGFRVAAFTAYVGPAARCAPWAGGSYAAAGSSLALAGSQCLLRGTGRGHRRAVPAAITDRARRAACRGHDRQRHLRGRHRGAG